MTHIRRNSKYAFLAVSEIDGLGFCGGLLILTAGGRPAEFHCTAPVSANRAQQILYGATLKEFLVCDQIGEALLNKARSKPDIVLVDDCQLLSLAETTNLPFAFVHSNDDAASTSDDRTSEVQILELDEQQIELRTVDQDQTKGLLKLFVETLPLTEPFERIYQAISEAHSDAA